MNLGSVWVFAAALLLAGCRAREITSLERKEAASDISEAEFAVTIKDLPRAEGLYARAAELAPDNGNTWMNLGIVRMRMHNPGDARSAYKSALAAYRLAFKTDPSDTNQVVHAAYVLTILGRADEARSLISDAYARYPGDPRLRMFVEEKGVERMERDPSVKELSP